jgi:CHAT domain-containing protein/Flp pilus assembly protein TadD
VVELSLDVPPSQSIVLRVEQFGIDTVFDVRTNGAAEPYTVDQPSEWMTREWLLLDSGHHDVTIRPKRPDDAPGSIRASQITKIGDQEIDNSPHSIEALRELTAGGHACAIDDWEKGRAHFETAARVAAGRADELEAVILLEASIAQWATGQSEAALQSAQQAVEIWNDDGPSIELAAARQMVGLSLQRLARNEEARAEFDRAMTHDLGVDSHDDAGRKMTEVQIRSNVCTTYLDQRDLEGAEPCLKQLLDVASNCAACASSVPYILNNLGGLYYMKGGQPLEAVAYYRKALSLHKAADALASTYNNIGLAYESSGRLREALNNYMQADVLLRDQGLSPLYARILGNIGALYLVTGDPYGAQPYLERALEMMDSMQDVSARPTILRDLGVARRSQGNASLALELHKRALNDASQADDVGAVARVHEELSKDYVQLGNLDGALREIDVATGLIEDSGDAFRHASIEQQHARVQMLRHEPESALETLPALLDEYKRLESWPGIAATYVAEADALTLLGRKQQAIDMLHSAMGALDSIAVHLQSLSLGPDFSSQRHRVFEQLIALTVGKPGSEDAPLETLWYSEQAHAMTLRYALSRTSTGHDKEPSTDAIPALVQQYASRLSDYLWIVVSGTDAGKERALSIELRDLQHRLEGLEAAGTQPTRAASITQSDIAAILGTDTVAVEYMLGESESYAWWLTDKEMTLVKLPPRSEIGRLVADALSSDPARNSASASAFETLSHAVLEPLSRYRNKQRLAVIADGVLTSIPFGQLVDPGAVHPQRYVIDQFEVVHLPSLLTTSLWASRQDDKADLAVAIFADPVFQTSSAGTAGGTWTALPRTRTEASTIASIFPEGATRQWLGYDASLQTLLAPSLPAARILHFATHGVVVPGSPQLTGLVLSQLNAQGTPVASFLGADMVPYLRLQAAPLVVLSGCETAGGRLTDGEGLVSLAQAFLYAGHRGVIASAWQVPDVATERLMLGIYQALAEGGVTPAQALRRAQLALRNDRRSFMQSAWRAFAYFGDWHLVPFPTPALRESAEATQ